MRFLPFAASLVLFGSGATVACSSDSNDKTTGHQHQEDSGAAGSGSGSGGKSSAGGSQGSGGSTDAGSKTCSPDAGPDECRPCLTEHCDADYTACTGDPTCSEKFDTYQDCFRAACGDANKVSECFSTFAGGIGAPHAKLTTCDYNNCSIECGGPIPL